MNIDILLFALTKNAHYTKYISSHNNLSQISRLHKGLLQPKPLFLPHILESHVQYGLWKALLIVHLNVHAVAE